ncbi:MAG TPA: AmmeMemoRadiSam system protein A [Vicinamibacterales bacterium]|nr:AmmeMemoRadiSam system protein A [Vicinamibacterales bacterium]
MLTDAQKEALVDLARRAVVATVTRSAPPSFAVPVPEASGVFVTIKHRGELRGCLGTLQCDRGLAGEVVRCAADAATEDPRFPPVSADELPELAVEVSVLGPLEPIDPRAPGAIVIGRHGLVAERGVRRGLLLPQVATEWGWTVEQFLRQTCLKAGLEPDAWQRDARVSRFEAEVIDE